MFRTRPAWNYFDVIEVELSDGSVGYGETMLYYTWGETTEADMDRVEGNDAVEVLWDESVGSGLQMAMFDAVGRALDVPVHRLLGEKTHDRTPHSWWAMDMPGEEWLAECERAIEAGYTDIKLKGRPWRDLRGAVATLANELPPWFEIDIDFNETLLDADTALPILEELAEYPQIQTFESPIPEEDVDGYRRIQRQIDTNVAVHYGDSTQDPTPPPKDVICADACDGFVVSGSAKRVMEQGAVTAMADKSLWLQLVGTGIMTAFSTHFGGVLEAARWPAISCHQIFAETLLEDPIEVEDGEIAIPDGPGFGVDVDRDAIERCAVERPAEKPDPERLIEVSWPDGRCMYFANYDPQMRDAAVSGKIPNYERGVSTRVIPEDELDDWDRLHELALDGPVVERD